MLFKRSAAFKMDVLKEVGNIGAGNAATALAKLIDKPVDMPVPQASLVGFDDIADRVGGSEQVVVAVFLRVEGDVPGNLFIIIDTDSANKLLHHLLGIRVVQIGFFSELESSALSEIGNILAGSYLSSLADFTKLSMMPTVPSMTIDMAGAVLTSGLLQFGQMGDDALLIETTFQENGESMCGHFFFIPDPESLEPLFRALGVPFE
ncbi:chemotaxis protein CheC [Paenibacillus sp. IB182496]|uniref:Chemotaxis protein CheC n=1 Tax=Paenibacillus sabuli TaxID=2772509 RepID=A0A927GRR8_9BACL|nr:chemotaxis protein CheC [Paenibacillus sabuli]MBD2845265.1 chemotaxis protein CheC [Paenibacillus sabuli]